MMRARRVRPVPGFDGATYRPSIDYTRLRTQFLRVRGLMLDGAWRTLEEIARGTGDPIASISAQLRHLRKPRFGSYTVERRVRYEDSDGLYEYRVLPPCTTN